MVNQKGGIRGLDKCKCSRCLLFRMLRLLILLVKMLIMPVSHSIVFRVHFLQIFRQMFQLSHRRCLRIYLVILVNPPQACPTSSEQVSELPLDPSRRARPSMPMPVGWGRLVEQEQWALASNSEPSKWTPLHLFKWKPQHPGDPLGSEW